MEDFRSAAGSPEPRRVDAAAEVKTRAAAMSEWAQFMRPWDRRYSMSSIQSQKIIPHVWYAKEAEEAARFYASIFPDSSVDRVTPLPTDSPSGPAGSVSVVEFRLFGQKFMAITAGKHHD